MDVDLTSGSARLPWLPEPGRGPWRGTRRWPAALPDTHQTCPTTDWVTASLTEGCDRAERCAR